MTSLCIQWISPNVQLLLSINQKSVVIVHKFHKNPIHEYKLYMIEIIIDHKFIFFFFAIERFNMVQTYFES